MNGNDCCSSELIARSGDTPLKLDDGKHCNEVSELARVKLHDVREKVAALQNMESALEQLIAGCDANQDDGFCHLISALQAKD